MIEKKIENFDDYEAVVDLAIAGDEPISVSGSGGRVFIMSEEALAHERWIAETEAAVKRSERQIAEGNYTPAEQVFKEISEKYFHGAEI